MAYDAASRLVVLTGGCLGFGRGCVDYEDTWTWDGTTWTLRPAVGTPALVSTIDLVSLALSYHPGLGVAVLLAADVENDVWQSQTWTWTGAEWRQIAPTASPASRLGPAMAYDPSADAIILFGGQVIESVDRVTQLIGASLGDTWAFRRAP